MFDVDNDGDVCLYEFYRFMGLELDSVESDDEKDEEDDEKVRSNPTNTIFAQAAFVITRF